MKRPPQILDPPRRKRALSEEERALWESVARQARPLRKKHRTADLPAIPQKGEAPVTAKAVAHPKLAIPVAAPPPKKPVVPPLAPLGRRERSQLSKGMKEIEARLDLHGMTQARAHRALVDEHAGRVRATVTSARPLDPMLETRLKTALERSSGKTVIFEKREDPSIMGGLVTQLGDTVYDGSVRTQLQQLREELLSE